MSGCCFGMFSGWVSRIFEVFDQGKTAGQIWMRGCQFLDILSNFTDLVSVLVLVNVFQDKKGLEDCSWDLAVLQVRLA